MTWADSARETMSSVLQQCRAKGMTAGDTAKAIDAAYPFGERAHFPYYAWLSVRKEFFARHSLPRGRAKQSDSRAPETRTLF